MWDQHGTRRQLTYPDGAQYRFTHDPAGRLVGAEGNIATPSAPVWFPYAAYSYDAAGRRTQSLSIGSTGSATWDDGTSLTAHPRSHTVDVGTGTRTTDMTWRHDGRLATETIDVLGDTRSYTYDAAGQLLARAGTTSGTYSYTYTARGQRQSATTPVGTGLYAYDDAGQLLTVEPATGDPTSYTYDPDGRRLTTTHGSVVGRSDTYDARGLIATTTLDGTGHHFTHDPDGLLTGAAIDGAADAALTWDTAAPVPQAIIVEVDGEQYRHLYGGERIAYTGPTTTAFYAQDPHGNEIATDDIAAPTDYDPYGTPNTASYSGFGYRGELHLADAIYLRNRTYDPTTGTFTTTDPLDGTPGTTTHTNPYHYADNDPTNKTDPLGLEPGSITLIVVVTYVVAITFTVWWAGYVYQQTHLEDRTFELEVNLPCPWCNSDRSTSNTNRPHDRTERPRVPRAPTPPRPDTRECAPQTPACGDRAAVDASALIQAIDFGNPAVDVALRGRHPVAPPRAAQEYLVRGIQAALTAWLTARGGGIGSPADPSRAAALQAEAHSMGRALGGRDAEIAASAIQDGLPLLTRDEQLFRFLDAGGYAVERW